jgi:hypothetical protein
MEKEATINVSRKGGDGDMETSNSCRKDWLHLVYRNQRK